MVIQHSTRYDSVVDLLNYFEEPKSAEVLLQNFDATSSYVRTSNAELVELNAGCITI